MTEKRETGGPGTGTVRIIYVCSVCGKRLAEKIAHYAESISAFTGKPLILHGLCPECARKLYPHSFSASPAHAPQ